MSGCLPFIYGNIAGGSRHRREARKVKIISKRLGALLLVMSLLATLCTAMAAETGFENFKKTAEYDGRFTDVPTGAWYYGSVADAFSMGLVSGKSSTSYAPTNCVTVGEAVALADRLYSTYSGDGYTFETGSPWYAPYVSYAETHGIIAEGQFKSYTALATRAVFACIFANMPEGMLAEKNSVPDNAVPDVAMDAVWAPAVYKLYRAGITRGSDSQGSYKPATYISRAEVAAIVTRMAAPEERVDISMTVQTVTLYADDGSTMQTPKPKTAEYVSLGWRTSRISVPVGSSAQTILNAATLRPLMTGNSELDTIVGNILAKITTSKMTTYQKVKACYDYIINTTSYGGGIITMESRSPYKNFGDYEKVMEALQLFKTGKGVCDDYAAAFTVLTRRIGVQSYCTGGETSKASGGFTPHAWNIIAVCGRDYVFDTQVEDNIARGGTIAYYRFCKTYSQVSENYRGYDTAADKANFGSFAPAD